MDTTLDQIRKANRVELQEAIRSLMRPGEKKDTAWWRIANKLGIPTSWVRRLDYGLWTDPPGSVLELVRIKVRAAQAEEIADIEPGLTEILTRMQILRGRLDAIDPDFHSVDTEALRGAALDPDKGDGRDD